MTVAIFIKLDFSQMNRLHHVRLHDDCEVWVEYIYFFFFWKIIYM